MKIIEMRPPLIGMGLFAIGSILHGVFLTWDTIKIVPGDVGLWLGLAGFLFMIWAWWLFKKRSAPLCPTARTDKLIMTGPYILSRNPMYLGMTLICFSGAIYLESLILYIATIIYFSTLQFIFIPYEENKLELTLGADYIAYKKKVRKWL